MVSQADGRMGTDGQYRMLIEERYKQLAETRSNLWTYATASMVLYSTLSLLHGAAHYVGGTPPSTTIYAASGAAALTYLLYQLGSGGRRPHRERPWMLWLFVLCSAALGLWLLGEYCYLHAYKQLMGQVDKDHPAYAQPLSMLLSERTQELIDPGMARLALHQVDGMLDVGAFFAYLTAAFFCLKYLRLRMVSKKQS